MICIRLREGWIFLFLLLLWGCKGTTIKELKNFSISDTLKGHLVEKDYFLQTSEVYIVNDSVAFFYSIYNEKNAFYFIDLESFERIASSGIIGKGPGEMVRPAFLYLDSPENAIWISDAMKQVIYKFPIDSVLTQDRYLPSFFVESSFNRYGIISHFTMKEDQLEYYSGETGEYILHEVTGDSLTGIGLSHIFIPGNKFENINRSSEAFVWHPHRDLVAVTYYVDDVLLIMSSNGEIIKKVKGPDFLNPYANYSKQPLPTGAYHSLRADSQYIYALYNDDGPRVVDENGELSSEDSKWIFVFNWKGEPVKKIVLEHPAYSFDLDKAHNRIITYSNYLDEEIVCYDYEF